MWQKALLLGSVLALAACSGSIATEIPGEVVTSTNLKVTAAVSGLTLGDEGCAVAAADAKPAAPGSCAPAGPGAAPREPGSGDIAPGGCGGYCRQSGVQISFKASAEGSAAAIEITKVVLIEGADKELETLTPSNPKAWNGTGYVTWGQNIAPGAEIRATYSLSSPAWSKNGGNYTKQYKVRITVKVGEGTTVIDSEPVSREAPRRDVKSQRLALGLFVGLFLLGLVAYLGKRPPEGARPVAEPAKSSVAVGDRFSPEGMLAEADRFVDDAAFRRAELERAFTNPKNSYSKERLSNYGLGKKGWDLLPEWNPRSVVATDTRNAESLMAGPPLWDGTRPKTMEAWVALGREVFFRYPMRADVIAKYAVEHPAEAATRGVVKLPDGTYPGLVHFVDIDGKEALGITCALCHSSSDGKTGLVVGEARRSFDFGALRLAHAASVKGTIEPELARRMRLWGPGRADVTEDDDEDPVAIPDLWGLRHQTHLTQAGTIRHEGPSALAIRQETQLLTSNHQKIRPPRVLAFALALFVYTLDGRTDPPTNHPGQPLFAQHCARCHANVVRGGDLVSAVSIGTDSALAVGQARGTGYYRTPALVRVKHGAPFLHHGAVRSVRELLSPERVLPGYHAGAVGDGPVPGHVFGTELPASEREMLAGYVEAL